MSSVAFLLCVSLAYGATGPDFQAAVTAQQRGDLALAEQKLRAELKTHPDEWEALSLLGIVLTNQRKTAEADAVFDRLAKVTESNAQLSSALGQQLVQAGQFARAEIFLTHALAADPANFALQYQLGVVASRAGHNDRARQVLEKALQQQPQNVEAIYALAFAENALRHTEQAVRLLVQAARLAPQRADVQKLLALTTGDLLAYEDSAAAWDRYMKLVPDDDTGRRERGFAKTNMKQAEGMEDLEWYVARHPNDSTGQFELGVAQSTSDPDKALVSLNKAIELRADFAGARSARGALHYQHGDAELALPDLEFAASKTPDSALVLDRLGQTYLLLDRPQDAVKVLRRAAQLAPSDAKTQLHTANALAQAGETEESKIYMNRYRQLGGTAAVPARGVMEYLSQTPEQQRAAYRARIEKALVERPDDAEIQVAYLKLSIGDGKLDQANATARKVLALKPGGILLTDAGRAMFSAHQYPVAKDLLQQAITADPAAGVDLELAIAVFHTDGAAAGLQRMDKIAPAARGGDYWAARAEMLSPNDAVAAMKQAIQAQPERADLYWQATALLVKNRRLADALQLINQQNVPDNAQIVVMRAMLLELTGKTLDAQKVLANAQRRWPENASIWIAKGSIQRAHGQTVAAKKSFGTATALGARNAATAPTPEKLFLSNAPQNW